MRPGRVPLIDLIQLLDGRLPDSRSAVLRELMAADSGVRSRCARVMRLQDIPTPLSVEGLIKDIERVALLVDGQGEPADEDWCLAAPERLAELAAVDRASRPGESQLPEAVRRRWRGMLEHECPSPPRPTGSDSSGYEVAGRAWSGDIHRRRSPWRQAGRKHSRWSLWLLVAPALSLVAAMIGWWCFIGDRPLGVADGAAGRPLPRPANAEPVSHDEPVGPTDPGSESPQDGVTSEPILVEAPPQPLRSTAQEETSPQGAERSASVVPRPNVASHRPVWTDVVGLVAAREGRAGTWRGVLSTVGAEKWDQPMQYRSWPDSWGRAVAESGVELIIAGEAAAVVGVSESNAPGFDVQLSQGQLALAHLPSELAIHCELPGWMFPLTVTSAEATLAMSAKQPRPELLIVSGEALIGAKRIAAPAVVRPTADGNLRVVSARRSIGWSHRPNDRTAARLAYCEPLAKSSDLLSALVSETPGQPDAIVAATAKMAFAIDPATTIASVVESPREPLRAAAVAWLASTPVDDPDAAAAWRSLQANTGTSGLHIHSWIAAVQQGTAGQRAEFWQELAQGIGPGEPLFVRQTAIYLLRTQSGQPFPQYDAANPAASSIREIRQQVRQIITRLTPQRTPTPIQRRGNRQGQ